jgi:RNA polymerase sigma factor (sigma-70 family)
MAPPSNQLLALRRGVHDQWAAALPDAELLRLFVTGRDETAFHIILQRHGPMVLGVCRAMLPNEADAEDAFQATFLVLAHKARSIRKSASLASWLHGVACRTARMMRTAYARRSKHEPRAARPEATASDDLTWREVQRVVHEELAAMAERFRGSLTLCYLQGKTLDEAAQALSMAKNTLKARLERGRTILRSRLIRRGLGSAAVLVAAWPAVATALPAALAETTLRMVSGASVSSTILTLKQGVLHTMFLAKLKLTVAMMVVITMIGLGVGGLISSGAAAPVSAQEQGRSEKPPAAAPSKVARDRMKDRGGEQWERIMGLVKVINARTLEFQDGTRIDLDLQVPYPDQMALDGDRLYPCGKEAAVFLSRLIGDKPVTCFRNTDRDRDGWIARVGDVIVEQEMVLNGWALAHNLPLQTAELTAREARRGLWRGRFIPFDDWEAGLRLPGEPSPPKLDEKLAQGEIGLGIRNDAARSIFLARLVKDQPGTRRIGACNCNLTDSDFAQIAKLTELEELNLGGFSRITEAGLVHLKSLTKLKRLTLPLATPAVLAHLKAMPNLKYLDLHWAHHNDASLEQLADLTQLEDLWLGCDAITNEGLRHLKGLHHLRRLIVSHRNLEKITDAGLVHLSGLANLRVLEIHGRFTDAAMPHLKDMAHLEYLDISGSDITDAGLEPLFGLKKLRVLKLPDRISDQQRTRLNAVFPGLKPHGFSFRYETDGLRSW